MSGEADYDARCLPAKHITSSCQHVTFSRWFNVDCSLAEGLYSLNDEIAAEAETITGGGGGGSPSTGGGGGPTRGGGGGGPSRGGGGGGGDEGGRPSTGYGAPGK